MGKSTERLPTTSFEGPFPDFALSDEEWGDLEKLLERPVSNEARLAFPSLVQAYFENKRAEDNAPTYTEALRALTALEKQAQGLWGLAHPEFTETDAEADARHQFEWFFSGQSVPIDIKALWGVDHNAEEDVELEAGFPLKYVLRPRDLSNLAIAVRVALDQARKHYEDSMAAKPQHFQPGRAFVRFGFSVRAWATQHELPRNFRDPGNRPQGTPLACFLFHLGRSLPEEFAPAFASADSLGRKLNDARRAEKKVDPPLSDGD